jgi:nitroreductase
MFSSVNVPSTDAEIPRANMGGERESATLWQEMCCCASDRTHASPAFRATRDQQGQGVVMDVFDAVRTVLAVRHYRDTPVPAETVRHIVEAGHLTASSMNKQPWHFILVDNRDTLKRLADLAPTGPYIAEAPLAVVVAIDDTRFAVSDASRAIQSMLLTAWADGVGSNWVGFGGLDGARSLLDIPGDLDVLAILPFGYPTRTLGRGKKQRRPLREVAHQERFGRPFTA